MIGFMNSCVNSGKYRQQHLEKAGMTLLKAAVFTTALAWAATAAAQSAYQPQANQPRVNPGYPPQVATNPGFRERSAAGTNSRVRRLDPTASGRGSIRERRNPERTQRLLFEEGVRIRSELIRFEKAIVEGGDSGGSRNPFHEGL